MEIKKKIVSFAIFVISIILVSPILTKSRIEPKFGIVSPILTKSRIEAKFGLVSAILPKSRIEPKFGLV